jgi:hypothetical protein
MFYKLKFDTFQVVLTDGEKMGGGGCENQVVVEFGGIKAHMDLQPAYTRMCFQLQAVSVRAYARYGHEIQYF